MRSAICNAIIHTANGRNILRKLAMSGAQKLRHLVHKFANAQHNKQQTIKRALIQILLCCSWTCSTELVQQTIFCVCLSLLFRSNHHHLLIIVVQKLLVLKVATIESECWLDDLS